MYLCAISCVFDSVSHGVYTYSKVLFKYYYVGIREIEMISARFLDGPLFCALMESDPSS